jgi:ABC-type uncharacterized transport system ATPase subunit
MSVAATMDAMRPRTILHADGITKWFDQTCANDGVDLELAAGEVHALLGQNGAGKSTFVGIVTGRYTPDAGRVLVDGVELPPGHPRAAAQLGIATVFQELMLVPSMTGLENIALALEQAANRETRSRVVDVQKEYELPAQLDVPVRDLEVPERQRLELVRALCQEPKVLLLDEPTSLLPPTGVGAFLQGVKRLANRGLAVLLITHRLDEARSVSDRISVMRHGRLIAGYTREKYPSNSELALEMLGSEITEQGGTAEGSETTVLEVRDLSVRNVAKHVVVDSVSFELHEGEVLGLAGVDGNGQLELLEAIAGLRPVSAGAILYRGEDITRMPSERRFRRGIQIVSGDRRHHEIVPTFAVSDHFVYVFGNRIEPELDRILQSYGVRPPHAAMRADRLSGGNQQKMILARACEGGSSVMLASYPMQGLDVQASLNVRELLVARARQGGSLIVASSDVDELLSISNRILVMNRGRVMGIQDRAQRDRSQLAEWLAGAQVRPVGDA